MTANPNPHAKAGRPCTGLYPNVSRTLLAQATGYHLSTITGMLKGRTRVPLSAALTLAPLLGVDIARLSRELEEQQQKYKEAKATKRKRRKRK